MRQLIFFVLLVIISLFKGNAQTSDFIADTLTGCVPMQVTFTDLSAGNPVAWEWDMGDGSSHLYVQHPTYVFNTPGVYSITLIVTFADSTKKSKTINNYITSSSGPYVNFSSNQNAICPYESIHFIDTIIPGGTNVKSRLWDFGDGGTSTIQNPYYTYKTPGIYKVSLTAYNQMGCATKTEKLSFVTVNSKPIADFVADSIHCVNDSADKKMISFTNNSSGHLSSFWLFEDGTTSTSASLSKLFGVGKHDAMLIVTNDKGCKDTLLKKDYVAINHFVALFSASDTVICDTSTEISFTGSNATQYTWTFGDASTDLGKNVKHTYRHSGKYTVTLYATSDMGCKDTVVKTNYITIYDSVPALVTIFENPHCDSDAVITFINLTQYPSSDDFGLGSVIWYPEGDTSVALSGDTATYVYGRYGEWNVKGYIITPYGCKIEIAPQHMRIFPMKQVGENFFDKHPGGCAPLTVKPISFGYIETSSRIVQYMWIWDNGDTTYSTQTDSVEYTYHDTGVFNVRVIVTNAQGCILEVTLAPIAVGFKPICIWTSTPTTACKSNFEMPVVAHDSLDSNGNLVGDAYANSWIWFWNGKDVTRVGDTSFVLSFNDTGLITYASLVCYHNFCPSDSVTKNIQAYVCPPIARIDPIVYKRFIDPFCNVFPVLPDTLNKSIGANLFRWNFGNDFDSTLLGGSNFKGDTSTDENPYYQYKYGPYLMEKDGKINLTLICANDNTSIYNACGYCEDTMQLLIKISYADMKMIATDRDSILIQEICQDDTAFFWDSTVCTSSLVFWGMRVVDSSNNAIIMDTTVIYHRSFYDSINYERGAIRRNIPVYFPDYGVYYVSLYNADTINCGKIKDLGAIDTNYKIEDVYEPGDFRIDLLRFVVNPRSVPDCSVPSPICVNDTVIFNDLSYTVSPFQYFAITDYLWQSVGKTDTVRNPTFVYTSGGKYDIALSIVNEKGCDSTILFEDKITVYKINAAFSKSASEVCNKQLVSFRNITLTTPNITSLEYHWDFDGQGTSTSKNAQFAFEVDTSRWVYIRLTVTDTVIGCSSFRLDSVYVHRFHADFYSPEHIAPCPELQCYFMDSSYGNTIVSWEWLFGDTLSKANTSALQNPSHNYKYAGKYDVTLIVTNSLHCVDTVIKKQYVRIDGPYGTFEIDTLHGCAPLTVHFTCKISDADTMIIITGDGNTITATQNLSSVYAYTYQSPERYIPSMQLIKWVTDSVTGERLPCVQNFWNDDTVWAINVNPDFLTDSVYCQGIPLVFQNFTDSLHGNIYPSYLPLDSFYWEFGNGQSDSIHFNGITQYDNPGTYLVNLTSSVKSCTKTKKKLIKVFDFPDLKFTYSDLSACDSLSVDFEAKNISGEELSFVWNFDDGVQLNGNPVSRLFYASGAYSYRLNVTFLNSQCVKSYDDTVYVNAWIPPNADFIILNAKGEDVTDRTDKGVKAKEKAAFIDKSTPNDGQILRWIWDFNDNTYDTTDAGEDVYHAYTTTSGIVTIILYTIDEYGCESIAKHDLLVLESLSFPNIFSPNNDGINDYFYPLEILGYFENFEMVIYTRWGTKVWQRNCKDPNCPNYEDENFWWNGKNKSGQDVSEGVYYWVVSATPKSQTNMFILNGSVTIVR